MDVDAEGNMYVTEASPGDDACQMFVAPGVHGARW
jgi:hypothetical protein